MDNSTSYAGGNNITGSNGGVSQGSRLNDINPSDIENMQTETKSAMSEHFRNTGSVSEACALVAAGSEAELIVFREISADRRATCSIAKGKF